MIISQLYADTIEAIELGYNTTPKLEKYLRISVQAASTRMHKLGKMGLIKPHGFAGKAPTYTRTSKPYQTKSSTGPLMINELHYAIIKQIEAGVSKFKDIQVNVDEEYYRVSSALITMKISGLITARKTGSCNKYTSTGKAYTLRPGKVKTPVNTYAAMDLFIFRAVV